jgi:hypothetical protein
MHNHDSDESASKKEALLNVRADGRCKLDEGNTAFDCVSDNEHNLKDFHFER